MPATVVESAIQRALALHRKRPIHAPSKAQAGVLLLVYPKDGELHVLLNKRSQYVENHKGEVAFPGGARDAGDETLLDTALRETWEEMGIQPSDVTVLGELDDIVTISDFVVTPYVGEIPGGYRFLPNIEVDEVIEAPLAAILDPGNARGDVRMAGGHPRRRAAYAYDGHLIWGATAMILEGFVRVIGEIDYRGDSWKTSK